MYHFFWGSVYERIVFGQTQTTVRNNIEHISQLLYKYEKCLHTALDLYLFFFNQRGNEVFLTHFRTRNRTT